MITQAKMKMKMKTQYSDQKTQVKPYNKTESNKKGDS